MEAIQKKESKLFCFSCFMLHGFIWSLPFLAGIAIFVFLAIFNFKFLLSLLVAVIIAYKTAIAMIR